MTTNKLISAIILLTLIGSLGGGLAAIGATLLLLAYLAFIALLIRR